MKRRLASISVEICQNPEKTMEKVSVINSAAILEITAAHLTEFKMSKARGRKVRFVRYVKEQFKEVKITEEEVNKVEDMEPARFYELTLVELLRAC